MAGAQRGFRRVEGDHDLPNLISGIPRELHPTTPTEEAVTLIASEHHIPDSHRSSTASETFSDFA